MVVCALCAFIAVMSFLTKLDIYAVAQARLEPVGLSKVVQALQTSRVRAVYVENGRTVHKGDVLVEFDSAVEEADRVALEMQLKGIDDELRRRNQGVKMARSAFDALIRHAASSYVVNLLDADSRDAVLASEMAYLRMSLESANTRILDSVARRAALNVSLAEQQKLIELLTERVDMRRTLLKSGLGPRISVIDAEESLANALGHLADLRGEWAQAGYSIRAAELERKDILAKFTNENTQAIASATARREQVVESLAKAMANAREVRVLAPIAGTVQELAVSTSGQVVLSGQKLMTLVPHNATLEAEALVENRDIGVIQVGQRAVLKVESFPFARYGTIEGTVTQISPDAVARSEGRADFMSVVDLAPEMAPADRYVYPVTIALNNKVAGTRSMQRRLLPGMNATVEIKIGERRAIDYLLAPLREISGEAIRER